MVPSGPFYFNMVNFQFFNPLKKRSFLRNKNVREFNPNNNLILNRCGIRVKNVVSKNKFFLSHQTLHLLPLSHNPKPGKYDPVPYDRSTD